MERIASFTVNHDVLVPGLYLSRRAADCAEGKERTGNKHGRSGF